VASCGRGPPIRLVYNVARHCAATREAMVLQEFLISERKEGDGAPRGDANRRCVGSICGLNLRTQRQEPQIPKKRWKAKLRSKFVPFLWELIQWDRQDNISSLLVLEISPNHELDS
jgi:hypothetical protein